MSKKWAAVNKRRLEMYLTAKPAGASAEKENHCCRYSVRATSALIALAQRVFGVHSACFGFLHACLAQVPFCCSKTSSDKVSELFERME